MIKENLELVEEKILTACAKSGRNRSEIQLIAVSKTKPISLLEDAYQNNIRCFGENKPQEMKEKSALLPTDIKWHMIGHLQRNKIKYIIEQAALIHSIDSLRLAEAVSKEAQKRGHIMPVLVEVNVAKEESKNGIYPEECAAFVTEIAKFSGIHVKGLMTVAPFVENAEENRMVFRDLRKLYVDIKSKNIDNVNMCTLSMGMTGDYHIAIEEGATMIRVGTGIFGERNYGI